MAALCSICAEETATERKKREEGAQKRVKRWALLLLIHLKYVFWQRPAFLRCEFAGGKFAGSIFIYISDVSCCHFVIYVPARDLLVPYTKRPFQILVGTLVLQLQCL